MKKIRNLTWAEINLNALENNLKEIKKHLPSQKSLLCVVKANAYGHGAVEVSRCLEKNGINQFAVAYLKEGIELREAGISSKIIVFGGLLREEINYAIEYDLTPVIYSKVMCKEINSIAEKKNKRASAHIEIDTGMGRLGILPEEINDFLDFLKDCKYIEVEGIMMHFAEADSDDDSYTLQQLSTFEECKKKIINRCISSNFHAANSAAFLKYPDSIYSSPRIGLMLYGYKPCEDKTKNLLLKPVMTLKSRILHIKEVKEGSFISYGRTYRCSRRTKIATIGCGYADGLNRKLSNNFDVLVNGKFAPLLGRICMDQAMIDITDIDGAKRGDEVVLMGIQDNKCIGADDIAKKVGTIPYEILCAIGQRVDRVFVRS